MKNPLTFSVLATVALLPAAIGLAATWVRSVAAGRVFGDLHSVPNNDVGLVLGTSEFSGPERSRNPHFTRRIAAAAELFQAGKVRSLLLSGNCDGAGYDEPGAMAAALVARGVPAEALLRDGAGFRTLDSVVRARRVFGQRRLTIVTDRFHTFRAVFLARQAGIDAVAFPSTEVPVSHSLKTRAREYLADVCACLDVYLWHTAPRVPGGAVVVPVSAR